MADCQTCFENNIYISEIILCSLRTNERSIDRQTDRQTDRFVWESVCVAIFILKACTYLCNNYFYKLVLVQRKNATKQHLFLYVVCSLV